MEQATKPEDLWIEAITRVKAPPFTITPEQDQAIRDAWTAIRSMVTTSLPAFEAFIEELAIWHRGMTGVLSDFDLAAFEADLKQSKQFRPALRRRRIMAEFYPRHKPHSVFYDELGGPIPAWNQAMCIDCGAATTFHKCTNCKEPLCKSCMRKLHGGHCKDCFAAFKETYYRNNPEERRQYG